MIIKEVEVFKIGDFSRFSRVSVKMLRHYDDLGLLKPAKVDPESGYRYYAAEQLPRLNRIVTLKDLGFSLEQIARLLDDNLTSDEIRGMLKLRRVEIEERLHEEQMRLVQVQGHLSHLDKANTMPHYDVILRQVEPNIYATIRAMVSDSDDIIQLMFEELEGYVADYRARALRPPLMIYHDSDGEDAVFDVEVAVPVSAPVPNSARVTMRELPGHDMMACIIHKGDYTVLHQTLTALLAWVDAQGYGVVGELREIYLRFSADEVGYTIPGAYRAVHNQEFVTELQLPVCETSEKSRGQD